MIQDFNQANALPLFMRFEAAYVALGIGEFSEAMVMDAVKNGPAKTISVFHKHLNEQLDRDNVKSVKLRAIHINRYYAEVYRFNKACENLTKAFKENK